MRTALFIIGVIAIIAPAVCGGCSDKITDTAAEAQIFNLINQVRVEEGLPELIQDPNLYELARKYCEEMYNKNVLTHEGFESRASRSGDYSLVGENLARDYDSPQALVDGWLQSPTHRNNILCPFFTHTGLAYYNGYAYQIFGGFDPWKYVPPTLGSQ